MAEPKQEKEPKTYKIPSKDWGITVSDAADILIAAKEIENNTKFYAAAIAHIKKENATRVSVVKK